MSSLGCGYDEEFVDVPPDYLKCIVCHLVLRDPIQLIECGHHYCRGCFERIKGYSIHFNSQLSCPIDRQVIHLTKVSKDKFAERIIADLHVKCSFTSSGCTWVGELRNIETHRSECVHATREESKESKCSASEAGSGSTELFNRVFDRIEKCEIGLQEKDKDIAYLKFQLKETKEKLLNKDEDVEQLKQKMLNNEEVEKLREEVVQLLKEDVEELKIKILKFEIENSFELEIATVCVSNEEEIENIPISVDNEIEESKEENKEIKKKKKKKKKKKAEGTQNCESDMNNVGCGGAGAVVSTRSAEFPEESGYLMWRTRVSDWEYARRENIPEYSPMFGPCCSKGDQFRFAIELLSNSQGHNSIRLDFEIPVDDVTFYLDIELKKTDWDDNGLKSKTKKVCTTEFTNGHKLKPTWWANELCEIDEDFYKPFVDELGILSIICNYSCQHHSVEHSDFVL